MAEPIKMPFGLWVQMVPRNHKLDGVQIPLWEGSILGEEAPVVRYRDFLPWAVQKWLNRSTCHFWLWTQVGWRKDKFNLIRTVAAKYPSGTFQQPNKPTSIITRTSVASACKWRSRLPTPRLVFLANYSVCWSIPVSVLPGTHRIQHNTTLLVACAGGWLLVDCWPCVTASGRPDLKIRDSHLHDWYTCDNKGNSH